MNPSTKKIAQIKNLLRGQGRFHGLLLFTVGNNTALRVSDLLELQVSHCVDEAGNVRRQFWIREKKRDKRNEVYINNSMREAFQEYCESYPHIVDNSDNYLFFNTRNGEYSEAIKRGQVWKFISTICKDVGLHGNYGTHSLRKTWGYHARMRGVDLALIMFKLKHSSLAYIKQYLGIADDELQAVARQLNL